jgi:hypothetical protein
LTAVIDAALPETLVRKARRAIARLGSKGLRESYFTTFWLPRGAAPAHAVEEAVLALWRLAGVRCAGVEWWVGRSHTTRVPVDFHFDQDVKGARRRHPLCSSVFFFNSVRGGHLAVTEQVPGRGGEPVPAVATRLETVKPRRNRYALFDGNRLHGVLDARGRTPGRPLAGPKGRLRVTLVVNFWGRRPTNVPEWLASGSHAGLVRWR